MRASILGLTCCSLFMICVRPAQADGLPSFEKSAEQLQAGTVTIRVGPESATDELPMPTARVTVFSGVSLGDGLVVTSLFSSSTSLRITMPGGEQAKAHLRVVDQHSGLALLEMDKKMAAKLDYAEKMPKVGAWVISAAGWGAEHPLVSFGMVSGLDRAIPGGNYPPLLQCNMTTAETSSGAGIVNQSGKLLGIIVAADPPSKGRGWAYAVPVKHVQRLVRAMPKPIEADNDQPEEDSVVILRRRRPMLGMVLQQREEGAVKVALVRSGGPAATAGLKAGDQISATDGLKIRSVYQAQRPTWFKQPGDTVTFTVVNAGKERTVEVVLGGGVVVPGVHLGELFEPKLEVTSLTKLPRDPVGKTDSGPKISELLFAVDESKKTAEGEGQPVLEKALDRYRSAIVVLKGQSLGLEQQLVRLTKRYEELQAENSLLRGRLRDTSEGEIN